MKLTPEILAAAYDYNKTWEPFNKWNFPDAEEVEFRVIKSTTVHGWYAMRDGKHIIAISARTVGFPTTLIRVMAHEMIHLHQQEAGMANAAQHNRAFQKLAERVAKIHGYDPKEFW